MTFGQLILISIFGGGLTFIFALGFLIAVLM